MGDNINVVNYIRGFNRFYTNILGLLEQHILNSKFSLTEARILFELNEVGSCMASTLSARLSIDNSYMSRILAKFERKGLISKTISSTDNRVNFIELTEQGRFVIDNLIKTSNCQIEQLISELSSNECNEICAAMEIIKNRFTKATTNIEIRPFNNNDIHYIISRQINLYKIEYGFDTDTWKAYVADAVHQLINQFDQEKDIIYILEANGQMAGCIAVTHIEADTAQLRFFFIEPTLRGLGEGNKLMDMAVNFCKKKNYKHIILWTCSKLEAARHLYSKYGFQLTETHENVEWVELGEPILEEKWELDL